MRRFAIALALCAACGDNQAKPLPEVTDPAVYVDPRIGTGGLGFNYGSCFVGAAVPHGLAKPAPDTSGPFGVASFQHYSGYFSEDNKIRGFSSLHLHGTGATDYGILSVMPTLAFDASKTTVVDYETAFAKSDEHTEAGYYAVTLANQIFVELTATPRVAVHRYTFPAAGAIVIDLTKTLDGGMVDTASIAVDDNAREITGQLHHLGGMSTGFGGYTLYFVARASAAFTHQAWATGAALSVPAGSTTLAIGLSLVSADGARKNLDAEVPSLDFDAIAAAAHDAWTQKLSSVLVTGGTDAERRIFYTSLYHAFLMPSVIDDVDGSFVLAGDTEPETAAGYHQMSDLSLWDTYRTVAPLYDWLAPDSARDTAKSLIAFGRHLGAYPKWPIATGESGTMLGASAEIVLADGFTRGTVPIDGDMMTVLANELAGHGGRDQEAAYEQYGFVPRSVNRSVSLTTEYSNDDYAASLLMRATGDANADAVLARSHSWAMLYDPSVGFLRGRNADGTFPTTSFDPTAMASDYAEANAWQSLWMVAIHDAPMLADVLGGNDAAIAKLSMMFDLTKQDWDTADPSAANFPRPYYWAGNEPDINAPYVFAQLGRPDLTQKWVRWIADTIYTDKPEGVPGNDDGGTMGAWYVFAMLGLSPQPGQSTWLVGSPHFPHARVIVGDHELDIDVTGSGPYVQSLEIDGQPAGAEIDVSQAQTLHFVMSDSPTKWGR